MRLNKKAFTLIEIIIIILILTLLEVFFITQYKKEKRNLIIKKESFPTQNNYKMRN
jgi:competence protein ComGC